MSPRTGPSRFLGPIKPLSPLLTDSKRNGDNSDDSEDTLAGSKEQLEMVRHALTGHRKAGRVFVLVRFYLFSFWSEKIMALYAENDLLIFYNIHARSRTQDTVLRHLRGINTKILSSKKNNYVLLLSTFSQPDVTIRFRSKEDMEAWMIVFKEHASRDVSRRTPTVLTATGIIGGMADLHQRSAYTSQDIFNPDVSLPKHNLSFTTRDDDPCDSIRPLTPQTYQTSPSVQANTTRTTSMKKVHESSSPSSPIPLPNSSSRSSSSSSSSVSSTSLSSSSSLSLKPSISVNGNEKQTEELKEIETNEEEKPVETVQQQNHQQQQQQPRPQSELLMNDPSNMIRLPPLLAHFPAPLRPLGFKSLPPPPPAPRNPLPHPPIESSVPIHSSSDTHINPSNSIESKQIQSPLQNESVSHLLDRKNSITQPHFIPHLPHHRHHHQQHQPYDEHEKTTPTTKTPTIPKSMAVLFNPNLLELNTSNNKKNNNTNNSNDVTVSSPGYLPY